MVKKHKLQVGDGTQTAVSDHSQAAVFYHIQTSRACISALYQLSATRLHITLMGGKSSHIKH